MTKCNYCISLMSLYIDNKLSEKDKKKFEKHISKCENCRKELKTIRIITSACSGLEEELPPDFSKVLHEKLVCINEKELNKEKRPFLGYLRLVSTTAAVLCILVFLGFVLKIFMAGTGFKSEPKSSSPKHMSAIGMEILKDDFKKQRKADAKSNKPRLYAAKEEKNLDANDTLVRIKTSDIRETVIKVAQIYELYCIDGEKPKEVVEPMTMVSEIKGITIDSPYSKIIQVPVDKIDDFLDDLTKAYDKIAIESIPVHNNKYPGLIHIVIEKDGGSR